jgi:DNA-binding transcriptional ArsR family regulator
MKYENTQLDVTFNALANKHRRAIVFHLSLQPSSISELAKQQGLSLQAIHRHVAVLEDAHLLLRKKSGRCNFLALNRDGLRALRDWIEQYHAYWGSNQETLENYVENIERRQDTLHTLKKKK